MKMFSSQYQQRFVDEDDELDQSRAILFGFCSFCVELVGGSSKKQNWKGLAIALIVIAFICFIITAAIFLSTTRPTLKIDERISLTENDIYEQKKPEPWNGSWISDKLFTFFDKDKSIWLFNCQTLRSEKILRRDSVREEYFDEVAVSPSSNFILLPVAKKKIRPFYREFQFDLYEKSKKIGSIENERKEKFSIAALVYSNSDNLFAFIENFDVYLYNVSKRNFTRITFDGDPEKVHNGLVEWIYEYEIFKRPVLLFWSPTDRFLAFVKTNLSNVPLNHYVRYEFEQSNNNQFSYPYPTHGSSFPQLDIFIYHIKSGRTFLVPRPTNNELSDLYIYHVVWFCPTCLSVVYGSRTGKKSFFQIYEISVDRAILKTNFLEQTTKTSQISRFQKPFFGSNGFYAYFIRFDHLNEPSYPLVVRFLLNESFPQVETYSPRDYLADEILHVDQNNRVYFTGFPISDTLEKHVYRWTFASNQSTVECLSCFDTCGYAHARFSRGRGTYYIMECLGPSVPYSTLHDRVKKLALIEDNQSLKSWLENRSMPFIEYFDVPLQGKSIGHGMIILPPNYNQNTTIASYPVLVTINHRLYEQRVNKKFVFLMPEFVQVVEDQIGIVLFDAHGSLGQDESYFQDPFHHQYDDYLRVARHLKWNEKKFNDTLNETRFGLKAQGIAALIALKLIENNPKEKDEYRCAFLQSPVTSLTNYHAVFTERLGYFDGDFATSARQVGIQSHFDPLQFENKSLAFVHGTASEFVDFRHSANLARWLIEANIDFDFKVYPDGNDDFERNPLLFKNLFNYQRRFFRQCLGSRTNKERKITIPDD